MYFFPTSFLFPFDWVRPKPMLCYECTDCTFSYYVLCFFSKAIRTEKVRRRKANGLGALTPVHKRMQMECVCVCTYWCVCDTQNCYDDYNDSVEYMPQIGQVLILLIHSRSRQTQMWGKRIHKHQTLSHYCCKRQNGFPSNKWPQFLELELE